MFKSKGSHAKRKNFSGEIVTVKDSRHGYLRNLKIKGHSYQRKNLFPIVSSRTTNGVTFTSNGDGTYTVNGTALSPYAILNFMLDVSLPLGQYFLSGRPVDGVGYLAAEGTGVSDNGAGATFTVTDPTKKYRFYYILTPGLTANNMIIKPMLRRAGTSPDFEPGDGGRFMPEAPSEILNVPSEIDFAVNNKNLFTTAKFGNVTTPQLPAHFITIAGVNAFSGSKNHADNVQSEGFIFEVLPNTQYTVSFHFSKEILVEGSNCTSYLVWVYDKTGGAAPATYSYFANSGYVGIASDETGDETFTFTTPTGCDMIGIVFSFSISPAAAPWNERVKMHLSNVQLEHGAATEFVPYQRITTPLTVKDKDNNPHTLGKWDYVDYLTGKIVKGGHTEEFNGDEDWRFWDNLDDWVFFVYVPDAVSGDVQECVCNQALYYYSIEPNRCHMSWQYFYIRLPKAHFVDINAWKAHLSTTPLVVEYELETPQVFDLHPDEKMNKPYTIEGDNIITTEVDGANPTLEFSAISYEV